MKSAADFLKEAMRLDSLQRAQHRDVVTQPANDERALLASIIGKTIAGATLNDGDSRVLLSFTDGFELLIEASEWLSILGPKR